MSDWSYTPHPKQAVAKTVASGALFVALVGLVMKMLDFHGIVGQIIFLIGAGVAAFVWMRYFYVEFRYTVSEEGYFEITRIQGKKLSVMCSVKLSDIEELREIPMSEKPKRALSFLSSMMPKTALLLKIRGDGRNQALLEADREIYETVSKLIEDHKSFAKEEFTE